MRHGLGTVAALSLAAMWLAAPLHAASSVDEPASRSGAGPSLPPDYRLGTEIVVRNWVLCISRAFAEELVAARSISAEAALETYDTLKSAKACGRFAEMHVILEARLDHAMAGGDARAFQALIDLAGDWASAYVVSGIPDGQ